MTERITQTALLTRARETAEEIVDYAEGDRDDAFDMIYENCEWDWVIYYGMAHDLVRAVDMTTRGNAEQYVEEMGYETSGYDEMATRLAYAIVHNAVTEAVQEVLDEREDS